MQSHSRRTQGLAYYLLTAAGYYSLGMATYTKYVRPLNREVQKLRSRFPTSQKLLQQFPATYKLQEGFGSTRHSMMMLLTSVMAVGQGELRTQERPPLLQELLHHLTTASAERRFALATGAPWSGPSPVLRTLMENLTTWVQDLIWEMDWNGDLGLEDHTGECLERRMGRSLLLDNLFLDN